MKVHLNAGPSESGTCSPVDESGVQRQWKLLSAANSFSNCCCFVTHTTCSLSFAFSHDLLVMNGCKNQRTQFIARIVKKLENVSSRVVIRDK